eukprot:10355148-Alexandrium_andersonii.AAC.1
MALGGIVPGRHLWPGPDGAGWASERTVLGPELWGGRTVGGVGRLLPRPWHIWEDRTGGFGGG